MKELKNRRSVDCSNRIRKGFSSSEKQGVEEGYKLWSNIWDKGKDHKKGAE